jgi:integrase
VSEVLAIRAADVDLDAVRIRTLKRRVEHWREVPIAPELTRDLEMVHPHECVPSRCDPGRAAEL